MEFISKKYYSMTMGGLKWPHDVDDLPSYSRGESKCLKNSDSSEVSYGTSDLEEKEK